MMQARSLTTSGIVPEVWTGGLKGQNRGGRSPGRSTMTGDHAGNGGGEKKEHGWKLALE